MQVKNHHRAATKARVENSAGGVVFRRTGKGILAGIITDSYGKWAFAKGHVEKGETPSKTAAREIKEEMGINKLREVAFLGKNSIWFKDRYVHVGETIHKYISYFLMEAPPHEHGRPQKKEGIKAVKWFPYRELPRRVSYKNIVPIAEKAVKLIDGLSRKG